MCLSAVRLSAPVDVTAVDVKAWNITLKWNWSVAAYEKLDMICQLKLNSRELTITVRFHNIICFLVLCAFGELESKEAERCEEQITGCFWF